MSRITFSTFALMLTVATMYSTSLLAQLKTPKEQEKNEKDPDGYSKAKLSGFTVYCSNEVDKENAKSKLKRTPLETLKIELQNVESVIPDEKLKVLRKVKIWVEWDEKLKMDNGREGNALAVFYGGHQNQLFIGGKGPNKAGSVTILSLKALAEEHQPGDDSGRCVTLHELAHAYHDQVKGQFSGLIDTTFNQARDRKKYDREVYAITNSHEYFAELTCAYLDRLDYKPASREQLEMFDRPGHTMMKQIWGPPKKKSVAKGGDLPSPDGDGRFKLTGTTEKVELGKLYFGELPDRKAWNGRPVLIFMFPYGYNSILPQLSDVSAWNDELKDFGLITIGVETQDATEKELGKIIRQRSVKVPFVSGAEFGTEERYRPPHVVLYDHAGKCVFRGLPLDAERHVRVAVGNAILAQVNLSQGFDPKTKPVADLLARGASMKEVLARLREQMRGSFGAAEKELLAIQAALIAGGEKALDIAKAKEKLDPVAAFFEAEHLPEIYFGTPLEDRANRLLRSLRENGKVQWETKARGQLENLERLCSGLQRKNRSFDPSDPKFKFENAKQRDDLKKAVETHVKNFPDTRAAERAMWLAEYWDVDIDFKKN